MLTRGVRALLALKIRIPRVNYMFHTGGPGRHCRIPELSQDGKSFRLGQAILLMQMTVAFLAAFAAIALQAAAEHVTSDASTAFIQLPSSRLHPRRYVMKTFKLMPTR